MLQKEKHQATKWNLSFYLVFIIITYLLFITTACSSNPTEDMVIDATDDTIDMEEESNKDENDDEVVFSYNQNVKSPNILLIIADDMGMDATPYATQLNSIKPTMPNLDRLVQNGVRFNNAWAYPLCTPTRGTIITGKHGRETGLSAPGDAISNNETTLQSQVSNTYATSVIGKWHLARNSRNIENLGIGHYEGNTGGGLSDYYNWTLHEDGNTTDIVNYYGTTAYTDFAIDWINAQDKPWFCWLAYNAAHSDFHTPKDNTLYTHQGSNTLDMYLQMLEAMDSEMGRLLANIPEEELANTTIIFIGDNGTPTQVVQAPFSNNKAKGSLFNGGVNVPLIVAGANVSRINERDESLIQSTDLFATIADLCGVTTNLTESISFKPLLTQEQEHTRKFSFVESDSNGPAFGGFAVRGNTYKLIQDSSTQTNYLYNVINDYEETVNLNDGNLTNEEQTALDELLAEYRRINN